jgi:hypothetical protein
MGFNEYVPGDTNPDPEAEFRKRGIERWVWESRPYIRYTPDHHDAVLEHHEPLRRTNQLGWVTHIVKQAPGWMCVRHRPPGVTPPAKEPEIVPQLRPDVEVNTGGPATIHAHPDVPYDGPVLNPYPYKDGREAAPLEEWRIRSADQLRPHINGKRGHNGVNVQEPHIHWPLGKYVFPPSPKVERSSTHDHAVGRVTRGGKHLKPLAADPDRLAAHLNATSRYTAETQHRGLDVQGPHTHTRKIPDRAVNRAKAIDMHPEAARFFTVARVVFLVIEGQWKADSLLSRLLAVLSVPSVTMWDVAELVETAAKYLAGKAVVIVFDADGHTNPVVMAQAWFLKTKLETMGLGIRACIAAPPEEYDEAGALRWKAVDDLLGDGVEWDADGNRVSGWVYHPEDLHVHERNAPNLEAFRELQREAGIGGWDAARNAALLDSLSMHANRRGELPRTTRTIAGLMHDGDKLIHDRRAVRDALERLAELGALDIEGNQDAQEERFVGEDYLDPDPMFGYVDPPLITIRPEYRAVDLEPVRLGDWLKGQQGADRPTDPHTVDGRNIRVWRLWFESHLNPGEIAQEEQRPVAAIRNILKAAREIKRDVESAHAWVGKNKKLMSYAAIARETGHSEAKIRKLVARCTPQTLATVVDIYRYVVERGGQESWASLYPDLVCAQSARKGGSVPIEEEEQNLMTQAD